ncbi:MAG: M18 family aminopeptidase [Rhodocyclaceae bacterium]|nr:M18 family aminopeptidase [Rhodocyclaceae bacterium]MBK6907107.1 M18 family aminopeptidase [Rhodocyclaceae bacterium]
MSTELSAPIIAQARDLLDFIDASPSPWHAVASAVERLKVAGFSELHETERWQLSAGDKRFVIRADSSLIAFIVGAGDIAEAGFRIVGAHTDSPGLRLKPNAPHLTDGLLRLGVEVYGGPILATFADRDLGLAGRLSLRNGDQIVTRLVRFDVPLVRLPNLAIHMNRDVNESGLKLHKQNELPLLMAMGSDFLNTADAADYFAGLLADRAGIDQAQLLAWDLLAYDTQAGSFWGPNQEFIASRQLDNLASCHAALSSLLKTEAPVSTALIALFDHEEVGSESAAGAGGSFMADVLARVSASLGADAEDSRRASARSFFISADMAHAWQPNFPAAYEPCHRLLVNAGPAIKSNANQRYSTSSETAARFMALCATAEVPVQQYSHRTDLGCGSTIGPIVAARLGMPAVDVGCPMWAMHSIRESAGVLDHSYLIAALSAALAS